MDIFAPDSHPLSNPAVAQVLQLAQQEKRKLFLVGGYLRDQVMRRVRAKAFPLDFDFTVLGGSAIQFAHKVANSLSGHFVLLDTACDTARVVLPSGDFFDFAGCLGQDLENDIKRRDFTINSLAWDADRPHELIDYLGAEKDIADKTVRLISEQALLDDPLRLLRAFRFSASLAFEIAKESLPLLAKHVSLLQNVAHERISYELLSLLESSSAGPSLIKMGEIGLLEEIFPELVDTRRVTKNAYHHLGLFEHSLEAVIQCEKTLPEMPEWARESFAAPLGSLVSRGAATKLACLLHDIGKPDTWVVTDEGKHTFIGHDKLGAEMCDVLAKRLKWSKPLNQFVEKLVRWHLRPGHLYQQGEPTDKALFRFYRLIDKETPELVLLALADFRSTCGPGLQAGRENAEQKLFELLNKYCVYVEGQQKVRRLIDGEELMKLLGIKQGPIVGQILEELVEAQALNEVQSHEQATDFVKSLFHKKYSK